MSARKKTKTEIRLEINCRNDLVVASPASDTMIFKQRTRHFSMPLVSFSCIWKIFKSENIFSLFYIYLHVCIKCHHHVQLLNLTLEYIVMERKMTFKDYTASIFIRVKKESQSFWTFQETIISHTFNHLSYFLVWTPSNFQTSLLIHQLKLVQCAFKVLANFEQHLCFCVLLKLQSY